MTPAARLITALGAAEQFVAELESVSVAAALEMACGVYGVDTATLSALWLQKLVGVQRARTAIAATVGEP